MEDKVVVSTNDLRRVAQCISNRKKEIMDVYHTSVKDLLLQSTECLKKKGISYEEEEIRFQKLFMEFDNSVTELVDVLENRIIPGYENLSGDIKKFFNDQFASEMGTLLNMQDQE